MAGAGLVSAIRPYTPNNQPYKGLYREISDIMAHPGKEEAWKEKAWMEEAAVRDASKRALRSTGSCMAERLQGWGSSLNPNALKP